MNGKHKAMANGDPSVPATSARLPSEDPLSSNLAQSLFTPLGGQSLSESNERQPRRAQIKVTTRLHKAESEALQSHLEGYFGFPLQLDIELDPEILGGVWVRVGDTVIDGSLSGQLEALRHHLCARCRIMLSSDAPLSKPKGIIS